MHNRNALSVALFSLVAGLATNAHAADLASQQSQLQSAIQKAQQDQQAGKKVYSVQDLSSLDREIDQFVSVSNTLISCASQKSGFGSQYSAQISQARGILNNAQGLKTGGSLSTLRPFLGNGVSIILQSAIPVAQQLMSQCQSFAAAPSKYDQVSVVMKQVFSGGDLGPNSAAVRHAADVDMPARGGTPESLKTYLLSQNGTVKNWYKQNYHLQ